jgi:hypothetical protein
MKTESELGIPPKKPKICLLKDLIRTFRNDAGLRLGRTRVFRASQWGSACEVILNCQRARDNRCYQTANGDVIMLAVLEPRVNVKMVVWATSSVKTPGTMTWQPGESKSEKKGLCQPSGTAPGYGMILNAASAASPPTLATNAEWGTLFFIRARRATSEFGRSGLTRRRGSAFLRNFRQV